MARPSTGATYVRATLSPHGIFEKMGRHSLVIGQAWHEEKNTDWLLVCSAVLRAHLQGLTRITIMEILIVW